MTPEDLTHLGPRQLRRLFEAGEPVDPTTLQDHEFQGLSLMPRLARRLVWTKFKKTFLSDGEVLRGWNVAVEQNALDAPWTDRLVRGSRKTYGFYEVVEGTPYGHPGTQVIVYGAQERGPLRFVYDPLVKLSGSDWLLSYSTVTGGPLPFTWFALREGAPLSYAEPSKRR